MGSSNEKLGPEAWSEAASGCHFQRAGILNKSMASPLVTERLGVWYYPETPLPPHVLMQTSPSANDESRNVFSSGINAVFATQQAASTGSENHIVLLA